MSPTHARIAQINIVARHFDETLKFYRLLGLEIPSAKDQPPGALHAPAEVAGGVPFALDNEHLAHLYNAARRSGTDDSSVLVSISFGARSEVDAAYQRLVAAGYQGLQPPYDAFWGSRYAIVRDPEGNSVGLMSAAEDAFRSWPPVASPLA